MTPICRIYFIIVNLTLDESRSRISNRCGRHHALSSVRRVWSTFSTTCHRCPSRRSFSSDAQRYFLLLLFHSFAYLCCCFVSSFNGLRRNMHIPTDGQIVRLDLVGEAQIGQIVRVLFEIVQERIETGVSWKHAILFEFC